MADLGEGSSVIETPQRSLAAAGSKESTQLDGLNMDKSNSKSAVALVDSSSNKLGTEQGGIGTRTEKVGAAEEEKDESKDGFNRAEMYTDPLVGSVGLYERHVFLCYKDALSWPPHVEAADFDRLPRHLVAALRARKNDMPKKTKLTICEGRDGSGSSNGDILIFPEMLKYGGLTHFDVDSFVEDVLVKGKHWIAGKPEHLTGSHIFVCAHANRDARCGYCGPLLIEKFKEEITKHSLDNEVFVRACSHVGGHKYAGNIIIYSPQGGAIAGHWYGYVTPNDVADLLEQHIGKGEIVERLWRGQMSLTEEEQKLAQNSRSQLEQCAGCMCGQSQDCSALEFPSNVLFEGDDNGKFAKADLEKVGQNGEQASEDKDSTSRTLKVEISPSRGGCRRNLASRLFETWELEDTIVATALIGAAVSVGLAYHFYRTSS
ncbi:hypothetical protein O6H91_12G037500 [Diphasiastrum complanatum]|uniref:Uncharacterized protein n=3 Tax=Diphasiastrum complanatum TaxID=34168 RepID=A0ACC2C0Y6_DIPCM|nr:hypothetical protein O6H91_12G029700 [Diphasiastrum complanatum]KAJ7535358.1 hypothetical protein O6H91_12G029700 [Diphasiastrum complanatum]KAJ7535523.1 hypothetical protein O6H91_12G037500 [Diphasiastrum complanatum]